MENKKHIKIVTIIDNNNYGNRLQNYALQYYLQKKMNIKDVVTLKNETYSNTRILYLTRLFLHFIKSRKTVESDRSRKFREFNKNIIFSKKITAFHRYNKNEIVITGSDQVWNPNLARFRNVDLLKNVDPSNRVSYAASFGVGVINKKHHPFACSALKKFKAISVREERGKELVAELSGRNDAEVVIDPTMLLESNEWEVVMKKPECTIPRKYILVYFLGGVSGAKKRAIAQYAEQNGCEIVDILSHDSRYFNNGPGEFLYLIKNAELICTDSFHSSVFSIIFRKPFVVFEREGVGSGMGSRLKTLLSKFCLANREFNGKEITEKNIKIDYSSVAKILKAEQEKSYKYLSGALGVRDEK